MPLPVLLYHHIGGPSAAPPSLSVSPEKFERQVRWLARKGYVGIRPSDWLNWLHTRRGLPTRPVLLTFDDAFTDLIESAFPVLEHHGFTAGVFVPTAFMGRTAAWDGVWSGVEVMTSGQIKEWTARGIEFGSHGRTHRSLIGLAPAELAEEVRRSADDLEGATGSPVLSFAYPYGLYDARVVEEVQRRFDLGFTVVEGMNDLRTSRSLLRRTMVQPSDSMIDVAARARLGWSPVSRMRTRLRRAYPFGERSTSS